jgi:uncharacterized protein YdeI (YjbR/CyaY-like superfamily)
MEDTFVFNNREEWHRWLSDNHNKVSSVWLVFYKKCSGKKGVTLDEAVEEALRFGWIDSRQRNRDQETFVLRFSHRKAHSVWSKINKERAERLIISGKMTEAGLAKVEEAKKDGYWESAYTNLTFEPVSLDLREALMKDTTAWNNFNRFANSYRNIYVFWVNQAKTPQTRQKRIKTVVEQSLKNKKLLT